MIVTVGGVKCLHWRHFSFHKAFRMKLAYKTNVTVDSIACSNIPLGTLAFDCELVTRSLHDTSNVKLCLCGPCLAPGDSRRNYLLSNAIGCSNSEVHCSNTLGPLVTPHYLVPCVVRGSKGQIMLNQRHQFSQVSQYTDFSFKNSFKNFQVLIMTCCRFTKQI